LGEIVDIVKTKSSKLKDKAAQVEYIELSDINTKSFEIINSSKMKVFELPSRASFELKEDDIITSVAGNSIGSDKHITALVSKDFNGAICTNGFRVLRNPKIDLYYLLYYLGTDLFREQIKLYRTGAAIPTISDKDFANILVYIPTDSEILEIADKVRLAFELRKQSSNILKGIKI
jgi:type I restriction enzyme M protein